MPVNLRQGIGVIGGEGMNPLARDQPGRGHVIDVLAAACAAAFVVILGIAAYWDRTIRVLHVFESLPYVVAAVLSLRRHKSGYVLGAASGAFWLWPAGTLVLFSLWGYSRTRNKSWRDAGLFLAAVGVVAVFFVATFAAFAPHYLGMFKRLF